MRQDLSAIGRAVFEQLEGRRLMSRVVELLGTSGDDHIVISFDPVSRDATVSGAANVADGTLFAASTHANRLYFNIDAGAGNDRVEMGLEGPGEYEYFDAARATMMGGS